LLALACVARLLGRHGRRGPAVADAEVELVAVGRHGDVLAGPEPAVEQHRGQPVVDLPLNRAAQRPGTELRLESPPCQPVDRLGGELHRDRLRVQPPDRLLEQQAGDLPQLRLVEVPEHDDLVDPVQELRPECFPQPRHDPVPQLLVVSAGGHGV
jgi:hypothetical protein